MLRRWIHDWQSQIKTHNPSKQKTGNQLVAKAEKRARPATKTIWTCPSSSSSLHCAALVSRRGKHCLKGHCLALACGQKRLDRPVTSSNQPQNGNLCAKQLKHATVCYSLFNFLNDPWTTPNSVFRHLQSSGTEDWPWWASWSASAQNS